MSEPKTLETRFTDLDSARSGRLEIARLCAAMTLPTLLPPKGQDSNTIIPAAFQSIGARGLVSLVSKSMLAMYPVDVLWYKLAFKSDPKKPPATREQRAQLLLDELNISNYLNASNFYKIKRAETEQILCCGMGASNCWWEKGGLKFSGYRFDQFVVKRDGAGDIFLIIVREAKRVDTLSDEAKMRLIAADKELESLGDDNGMTTMYTGEELQADGQWKITQEIAGVTIKTSVEKYPPIWASGYSEILSEDFSRSFVEEVVADLQTTNQLTKGEIDLTAAAAKLLGIFDPDKGGRADGFLSDTGSVLPGRLNENGKPIGYGFLSSDKSSDFSSVFSALQSFEQRLGAIMLMESAAQRKAERVTAYEVSGVRRELEGALGGYYLEMCEERQKPDLMRIMHLLYKNGAIKTDPRDIDIQITTGYAALNRDAKLQQLMNYVQIMSPIQSWQEKFNPEGFEAEVSTLMGIDTRNFMLTEAEYQRKQQAQMQMQMAQQGGSQAIDVLSEVAKNRATA